MIKLKKGGRVKGTHPASRPDRRARRDDGGSLAMTGPTGATGAVGPLFGKNVPKITAVNITAPSSKGSRGIPQPPQAAKPDNLLSDVTTDLGAVKLIKDSVAGPTGTARGGRL